MRRDSRGNMAELPVVLFTFFFMAFFPLMNLVSLAVAAGTIWLETYQTAVRASSQPRYTLALSAMSDEANKFNLSGLASFTKMRPIAGYQNCGDNLFVRSTNIFSGSSATSDPNKSIAPPIDTTNNVYEFETESFYEVGPLVNLGSVPFIGAIPGIGVPAKLRFSSRRAVEHPEGLISDASNNNFLGGSSSVNLSAVSGLDIPNQLTDDTGSGWNYPTIYSLIKQQGEVVVNEDVLIVNANDPNWTNTLLNVAPGDKVWIDYKANGSWRYGNGAASITDANGTSTVSVTGNGLPVGAMVGQMSSSPSTTFLMGKQKWNFAPPGTGTLSLKFNDNSDYTDNSGSMTVRVIVAR